MVQCETRARVRRARAGTLVRMSGSVDKANDGTQNKRSVNEAEGVRPVKYVTRRGCDRNPIQTDSPWLAAAKT